MMHLCGPQKSTLRPPHPDSHHFSTNLGRTHLWHTPHMPQSPHQSSETASHPSPRTPEGLSEANNVGTCGPGYSPVASPTGRAPRPGQQTQLLCAAMPVLPSWDSGKQKGRKVNWTHAFLPPNMLILAHYFLTLTCVPLTSKPPSVHEPYVLLDA